MKFFIVEQMSFTKRQTHLYFILKFYVVVSVRCVTINNEFVALIDFTLTGKI